MLWILHLVRCMTTVRRKRLGPNPRLDVPLGPTVGNIGEAFTGKPGTEASPANIEPACGRTGDGGGELRVVAGHVGGWIGVFHFANMVWPMFREAVASRPCKY